MQFPMIVKPTDRSGSRGIMRVESLEEIAPAVEEAVRNSFEKKGWIIITRLSLFTKTIKSNSESIMTEWPIVS